MNSNFWGRCKPPPGVTVDRAHPIAQNLELWHLCNEGSGQLISDVSGHGSVRQGIQKPAVASPGFWVPGAMGPTLKLNGTTQYVDVGSTHGMPTGAQQPWTFSFWLLITTNATSGNVIAANNNNTAGGGIVWEFLWSFGTQNAIRYQVGANSYVAAGLWDSVAVPLNKLTHVTVTDDGKMAAGSIQFWFNGAKVTTTQIAVPNPTSKATANLATTWGGSLAVGSYNAGLMDNFMICSRVLPDTMIRDLYSEPFAALAAPVWRRYFVPSTQSAVVARQVVARGVDRGVAWGVR